MSKLTLLTVYFFFTHNGLFAENFRIQFETWCLSKKIETLVLLLKPKSNNHVFSKIPTETDFMHFQTVINRQLHLFHPYIISISFRKILFIFLPTNSVKLSSVAALLSFSSAATAITTIP